jgi:hypothetical protein
MVHKQKREYIVSALGGTKWSPEFMAVWVKGDDVQKNIAEFKKTPDVRQIGVQRGDFMEYMRGFTPMGELSVIRRIRSLPKDGKVRVVHMSTPTGFFGVSKVVK